MPDIPRREFLAKAGAAVAGLAAITTVNKAGAETVDPNPSTRSHTMKRYVIEREIPGIGASN